MVAIVFAVFLAMAMPGAAEMEPSNKVNISARSPGKDQFLARALLSNFLADVKMHREQATEDEASKEAEASDAKSAAEVKSAANSEAQTAAVAETEAVVEATALEQAEEDGAPRGATTVDLTQSSATPPKECEDVLAKNLATQAPLWIMLNQHNCPAGYRMLNKAECLTVACLTDELPLPSHSGVALSSFTDARVPEGCFQFGAKTFYNPEPSDIRPRGAQAYCKQREDVLPGKYDVGERVFNLDANLVSKGIDMNHQGVVLGISTEKDKLAVMFEGFEASTAVPIKMISNQRYAVHVKMISKLLGGYYEGDKVIGIKKMEVVFPDGREQDLKGKEGEVMKGDLRILKVKFDGIDQLVELGADSVKNIKNTGAGPKIAEWTTLDE